MELSNICFYLLSILLLVTAGLVAFRPKPIESALWLILHFFITSALYVLLGSHFIAIIQILVYAGAIVVLFTFVILLLNLNPKELGLTTAVPWSSFVLFSGGIAAVLLCLHVATPRLLEKMSPLKDEASFGSVESLSKTFIKNYMWSFEVAGVLLLLALIGVGLLAYHRPKDKELA